MTDALPEPMTRRSQLLAGSRERRRTVATECEIRTASNGLLNFEGIFAIFGETYEVEDRFGVFNETVDHRALDRTLRANPDVVLNVNHDGLPLARTTSATLQLSKSEHAAIARAQLDPRDPDVQRVQYKIERKDMPDMSWAFRAIRDTWNDDETDRQLLEAAMDGGDVSIVTTGALRSTSSSIRSALGAFNDFDRVLLEARAQEGLDLAELRLAHENLGRLVRELTPRKTLSIRAAELELLLD